MDAILSEKKADAEELVSELAKLPEDTKQKLLFMIQGARLVSDARKVG